MKGKNSLHRRAQRYGDVANLTSSGIDKCFVSRGAPGAKVRGGASRAPAESRNSVPRFLAKLMDLLPLQAHAVTPDPDYVIRVLMEGRSASTSLESENAERQSAATLHSLASEHVQKK